MMDEFYIIFDYIVNKLVYNIKFFLIVRKSAPHFFLYRPKNMYNIIMSTQKFLGFVIIFIIA